MTSALILGPHLSGRGDSVKVCEELAERLRGEGWPIRTASHYAGGLARTADAVASVLRWRGSYRVAHVDVYSGRAFLWAEAVCLALEAVRKPFVLTLHGGALPELARRQPRRVRRLLGRAAAVTAPSSYLLGALGPAAGRAELIPNAIDLARYPFWLRARPAPRLIWLRAFHDLYNSVLAVETLARLKADFPQATLRMIGPDRGDGALLRCRTQTRRLSLEDAVAFEGPAPKLDVPARLAQGDIFLNTSSVDNTPVSVIEAMACGLCIVSTRVGGIPDLLEDGSDALLTSGDPAQMAAAVRRILSEPGLAERLSANARRKAEALDWSAVLPRWQELLTHAAEGRT
ncbi:MAG: glycosyltransferase [Acidobacteria bacterium]|nr:glycosyltransferase [Acidobacteriota bacterium]